MNNDCVMPAASHFNQVSYSGKEAFRPGELTYFVRTAVGGAPTLFFIHYSLLLIIHLITPYKKPGCAPRFWPDS